MRLIWTFLLLVEQLRKNREAAIPNKPAPAPQKGAGGGTGNPTNTRGTGTKDFEFKKPNTSASNKRAQMSIKRRTPVNTDSTGKRIPTTAEIRAKAKGKVGGGAKRVAAKAWRTKHFAAAKGTPAQKAAHRKKVQKRFEHMIGHKSGNK